LKPPVKTLVCINDFDNPISIGNYSGFCPAGESQIIPSAFWHSRQDRKILLEILKQNLGSGLINGDQDLKK